MNYTFGDLLSYLHGFGYFQIYTTYTQVCNI
jgi:hypothetical protein